MSNPLWDAEQVLRRYYVSRIVQYTDLMMLGEIDPGETSMDEWIRRCEQQDLETAFDECERPKEDDTAT